MTAMGPPVSLPMMLPLRRPRGRSCYRDPSPLQGDRQDCWRLAFTGQCIGDDMTSVGSRATRFISLQSGGTGGNREHWGHLWATGLKDLGGDIGAVAETRIYTEEGHAAASRGMLAAGYVAISHGVGGNRGLNAAPLAERDELLANGVILAVRRTYAGSWEHVARDGDGRGLAANVVVTWTKCWQQP